MWLYFVCNTVINGTEERILDARSPRNWPDHHKTREFYGDGPAADPCDPFT